jgi:hypothetical protein
MKFKSKKIVLMAFLTLYISSCAFLPEGKNVLEEKFIKDESLPLVETEKKEYVSSGRPIYIEAISYPQMIDGGHLALTGKMAIFIGRETVSMNQIFDVKTGTIEDENRTNDEAVKNESEPLIEKAHENAIK